MKKGENNRRIPISSSHVESFPIEDFQIYFKRTYFSLCQIIGMDAQEKISIGLMIMAMRIQNPEKNIEYDFASFIERALHEVFLQEKIKPPSCSDVTLCCVI